MRIAFAGNPNSGKTTMFNALTGQSGKVGNWGGVTVGKKEGSLKTEYAPNRDVVAVDLPGAYSMSPFSPEESITSAYVRDCKPDAIVNIVDATNMGRGLFFTTQLLELGIPVVVALNKSDLNKKDKTSIDVPQLEACLGCPVVETISTAASNNGLNTLVERTVASIGKQPEPPFVQADIDLSDKNAVDVQDRLRYEKVNEIVAAVEQRESSVAATTRSDKIDRVLVNPVAGILTFAAVMWAVFAISQTYLGPLIADWLVGWIETFQEWVEQRLEHSPAILSTLITDGIIGGVGAVIGFLPLVMVMYFLLALLEESGYMARVAVVLDPIFKRVGLTGKSVIPIVISTGCAIPGIMSARTIRDERERRATAMLASYIPCGAKIPVIALFSGVFFNSAGWVSWLCYFLGLMLIFLGALLIKAMTGAHFRKSFFLIELPRYRVPSAWNAFKSMLERAWAYIVKAATIILICNTVVQVMQSFDWNFSQVAENAENTSILASIATPFALLLIPLGFGTWQLAAAAVTGFIAKENVVGTLAVVYGLTSFIDTDELSMTGGASNIAAAMGLTSVSALAYLFFNLYTPPCFAAMGAMNSEIRDKRWLAGAIGLQFATGYTVAFLVYQVGTLLTTGHLGTAFLPGLITVVLFVGIILTLARKLRASIAVEYALSKAE